MPTAKKAGAKKSHPKKSHGIDPKYYVKLSRESESFWKFKPGVQTLYWVVIAIAVIGTAIINVNTSLEVSDLLNQIEARHLLDDSQSSTTTKVNPQHSIKSTN